MKGFLFFSILYIENWYYKSQFEYLAVVCFDANISKRRNLSALNYKFRDRYELRVCMNDVHDKPINIVPSGLELRTSCSGPLLRR